MLEKNKDYVEFTLQCTTVERTRDKDYRQVCFNGYSYSNFPGVPMDVVCKEFDHKVVVVGKRDFERLQKENERLRTENEQLKKKMNELDPMPEFKELFEKLHSAEDAKNLEWVLEHICGGPSSVNGWRVVSSFWKQHYETLSKLVGFSSVEEIEDYLVNEAECDTLHEAIASLEYSVKYARDERRDLSKKLEECEKDYISERDKAEALEKEIEIYSRTLNEWKEGTGCDSPQEAGCKINSLCDEICKLKGDYDHLLKLTGYRDELDIRVMLNGEKRLNKTMRDLINSLERKAKFTESNWQAATGCDLPSTAREKIDYYKSRLDNAVQAASCAAKHLDNITF